MNDEEDEVKSEAQKNKVKNMLNKGKSKLTNVVKAIFRFIMKKAGKWVLILVFGIILFVLLFNQFEKIIFRQVNSSVRTALGAQDTDGDGIPDEDIDFAKLVKIEKVDGEYCLKVEKEVFEKITKQLEENNISPEDLNIKTGNFDCFKEFIKAEITTQFPQLGNIDKEKHKDDEDIITDGIIKIKRAKDGQTDSNATQLFYMPQEDFKKLCDDNDSKALEYFSLDDDRNLLYASYEQTDITVTSSGDTSIVDLPAAESTYVITMQTIDYRSIVKKYTMPFSLQLAILQTSDSENFALEFSRLAENSEMVITIQDNIEENTYVEDIEAEQHIEGTKKIDYKINVVDVKTTTVYKSDGTIYSGPTVETINHGAVENVSGQNITYDPEQKNCTAKITTVVETNTPVLELTKVDCWNAKFENTYSYSDNSNNPDKTTDGPNTSKKEEAIQCNINTDPDIANFITERENYWKNLKPDDSDTTDSSTGNRTVITYARTVTSEKSNLVANLKRVTNTTSTLETTTIRKEYTTTRNAAESNEERIFRIFSGDIANDHDELNDQQKKAYKKELQEAYGSLNNAKDWFYGLLKEDSQTVEFIDIMKYLINKYNTGEGEFDFSDYDGEEFSTATGGTISYDSLNLSNSDLQILYKITEAERGDGTTEQKEYVVSVILNRVLSSGWPNTVRGVVFQAGQFQPTRNGAYDRAVPSADTKKAVKNVVKNGDTTSLHPQNTEKMPAVYFMTPAAAVGQQSWLCNCEFLFNDSHNEQNGSHNFYSSKQVAQELERYRTASSSDLIEVAKRCWEKICHGNYSYGGATIPINGSTVDCSSYASWVLYEYGYTDFRGGQTCTQGFKNTNWNRKYGWTEIDVRPGQNPYNKIEPGDLFVRDPGNNDGHITFVVEKKHNKIYCYDCGNERNWKGNRAAKPIDRSYMLTDSRPGKIIRVTPPQ